MEHYLEQLDMTEMMENLDRFFPEFTWNLSGMFDQILAGNWKEALSMIWQGIFGNLLSEAAGMKGLLATILLLGMLSVLISGFMTGFENRQIAEIAHTIFYLLLLAVLLKIFYQCYQTALRVLEGMTQFSALVLPALCLSLGPAAGTVTAAGYYELALFIIFLVENFILHICMPLMPVFMLLLLMNGVWEEGKLAPLMELLEKGILAASKFCLAAVTGFGFLQSMVAPALDSLKRGAAQKVISVIPGLGDLAEGTTQLLIGSAILVKNGLGVFVLLLLVALVAVPFGELLLYGVLLKVSGALVGVAADKRLTASILRTADAVFLSLRLAGCGAACFFILAAIITCLVGRG
ncbi:MAG: stage III sporulation protein AE [Eubacteriales bacterium]|nr:stage III sporulation protein AE [Eubacteriales bacterium]